MTPPSPHRAGLTQAPLHPFDNGYDAARARRQRLRLADIVPAAFAPAPGAAPARSDDTAFAACLRHMAAILAHSPTGRALLHHGVAADLRVGIDPLLEPQSSFYYAQQNRVDLGHQEEALAQTEKGLGRYLVSFVGALRRSWHHHEGTAPLPLLAARDYLDHFRLMQADIEAVTHLVAWELRAASHSFLWRALINGIHGDIAYVFEQSVCDTPENQFNGNALKAAFNQWFAERERVNAGDRLALDLLDGALLHDGAVGTQKAERSRLQHVGLMPGGRNYLEGCLFTSAWYGGLDDEFNRNYLAHLESDIAHLVDKEKKYKIF